jgi:amidase
MAESIDDMAMAKAAALAYPVADGQVSALELRDAGITHIEIVDRTISAVVVRDFERARDPGRAVDQAVARGERWTLMGIPMTVKGAFDAAGPPTTFGLELAPGSPTVVAKVATRLVSPRQEK